jgi:uncharacterized protein YndB with AHSA1/START domain
MADYERTATIDADPEALFDYLADVHHLPDYLPRMTEVEPAGVDAVMVEGDFDESGHAHQERAWFHVDELERRIEWGADEGPYHGWLQVDPGDIHGSVVTIHLHQEHEADTDADLVDALDNIRHLVEVGEAPNGG